MPMIHKTQEEVSRCNRIAAEAFLQIIAGIGKEVFQTWECSEKMFTFYHDMPTLILKVTAAALQGRVLVSLDEGKDTYTITLITENNEVKRIINNICCDMLGFIINENINYKDVKEETSFLAKHKIFLNKY